MPNRSPWRRADVALALLVVLALFSAFGAVALSKRGLEAILALVVTICSHTLNETLAHSADLARLLLLIPLGLSVALGAGEALRLLLSTHRWTTALTTAQRPVTKRLRRLLRRSHLAGTAILVDAERPLVFTQGLLNPKVWLSTGLIRMLSDDELEAVLRHEAHHLKARDPLKILTARCLARALFFVPVAHEMCEAYCVAKEITADEHTTQAMGNALPLARAIRKLLAARPAPTPRVAFMSALSAMEARLLALLNPARSLSLFPMKRLGLSLLWLLVLLVVAFAPAAGQMPSFSECAVPYALGIRLPFAL